MPILLLDQGTGVVVPALPQITEPAVPLQPSLTLGCGVARAEIWARGGGQLVLDLPDITGTEWERVRSETSVGSVTLDGVAIAADVDCCAVMNTIRPWKHELHIYRDDGTGSRLGWCGPITEVTLDGDSLTIKARDLSAWFDRRFIHSQHQWGGTQGNQGSEDPQTIFLAITTDAIVTDASPLNGAVQLFTDTNNGQGSYELAQRTYTPAQFKHAGPEMRDLAKGALDWTVVNRVGTVCGAVTWQAVTPNPVVNPKAEVNTTGWAGMTRDTGVLHSGVASFRTAAPPAATGSIIGLTVGHRYLMRVWVRGTSSALDAAQVFNDDGVVKVGSDESSVFSWYVYGQPLNANFDNRGRNNWIQLGVYFTATASTMPITITASGAPIDSHGIYFDDFDVLEQVPSFALFDASLAVPPKIALSGLDQANRQIVANQQSGGDYAVFAEAPKPAWTLGSVSPPGGVLSADAAEFGLLEDITTQQLSDGSGVAASAGQRAAVLSGTPLVIDNLTLAPSAGVTMDQLVPGALFTLRLDEPCFAVQANLILQKVTVRTSPTSGETVTLAFQPTGF